jgi:hypothetical protein
MSAKDLATLLRKINNRNVARFHGGMRRAARATKKLVKQNTKTGESK